MKFRGVRVLAIVASAVVVLGLGYIAVHRLLWETWYEKEQIILADGSTLDVIESGSERRFFGDPHSISFGGGDPTNRIEFSVVGKSYQWEGPYIPVVLQFDHGQPVLIVFDRETDTFHCTFRYYRISNARWSELPLSQFPSHLAWQNLWLSHHEGNLDEYEVVKLRDPDSFDFQESFTAKIWHCIDTGQQYWQIESENVAPSFLREFMARQSAKDRS